MTPKAVFAVLAVALGLLWLLCGVRLGSGFGGPVAFGIGLGSFAVGWMTGRWFSARFLEVDEICVRLTARKPRVGRVLSVIVGVGGGLGYGVIAGAPVALVIATGR